MDSSCTVNLILAGPQMTKGTFENSKLNALNALAVSLSFENPVRWVRGRSKITGAAHQCDECTHFPALPQEVVLASA